MDHRIAQVISEIDISKYTQKEYSEIVALIYAEFQKSSDQKDLVKELVDIIVEADNLISGLWVYTETVNEQTSKDHKNSLNAISERVNVFETKHMQFVDSLKILKRTMEDGHDNKNA